MRGAEGACGGALPPDPPTRGPLVSASGGRWPTHSLTFKLRDGRRLGGRSGKRRPLR
jgi:hypothetical protein